MRWAGEPDLKQLLRPIADLLPDEHQARAHDNRSLYAIRQSLEVHGQKKPIVVEASTGQVKAGNGTLAVARGMGWTHLAVVASHDSPTLLREFAIRDNRTAELSTWDTEALQREMEELTIEPELLGWQGDELAETLRRLDDAPPSDDVDLTEPEFGHRDEDVNERFMVAVPVAYVQEFKAVFKEHAAPLGAVMRLVR